MALCACHSTGSPTPRTGWHWRLARQWYGQRRGPRTGRQAASAARSGGWVVAVAVALGAAVGRPVRAADWPTYLHDNHRSGVTSERLALPLHEQWRRVAAHAPRPAWPKPAVADLWHRMSKLNPSVTYDRAYHVVAVGDALYFALSADDKVTCLDAGSGQVRWSFFAGGPVRLTPSVDEGRVFFGSDDGSVYALRAGDGSVIWRRRLFERARCVPGNGRMISVCPVRTGTVVQDGKVYVCAGLFPNEGVAVCALDAVNGSVVWRNDAARVSPQGYLLASPTRLYVPTGRTTPVVFNLSDGKRLGEVKSDRGEGGTYALLTGDQLIHGPGENAQLSVADANRTDRIAGFDGLRLIATPRMSYLQTSRELRSFDRVRYLEAKKQREALARRQRDIIKGIGRLGRRAGGKEGRKLREELKAVNAELKRLRKDAPKCLAWQVPCANRYALVLAGDVLLAGGEGEVAVFATTDGKRLWTGRVDGRACGLTVANGRLIVSTDTGAIHCFASAPAGKPQVVKAKSAAAPPAADDAASETAEYVVAKTGVKRGYALVLGCGEGRLACELARRTELTVVGIESDASKVAAARRMLDRAGVYGVRVSVQRGDLARLPYGDGVANLIVSDAAPLGGRVPAPPDEVARLLRPGGGVAWIGVSRAARRTRGEASCAALRQWVKTASLCRWELVEDGGLWAVCRRGALPGVGQWTHMYADPANTSCSRDERADGPMRLQWFGRPGPREIVDRHHRNVPPLVRDGRAFVPGDNRLMAIDAYNGTPLWDLEVPNSRRLGAPFDAGNMVVTDDRLYLAVEDRCLVLDPGTGRRLASLSMPQLIEGQRRHWGYLGVVGDRLYGSGRKPKATYTEISYGADAYQWGDYKRMVTSGFFFCLDRVSGQVRWTHRSGVIVNPSLAIGGGRVYLVDSRSAKAAEDADGQMELSILTDGEMRLTALDAATGKVVWSRPRSFTAFKHILYLMYADETLIAFGTRNRGDHLWHDLVGFDARTGEERWHRTGNTGWQRGGTHGEQERHPVIVNQVVYTESSAYDLRTGEPQDGWKFDYGRRGCGTVTAAAAALFYRDANPMMMDLSDRTARVLSRVNRPGCWVNIIPASGLVVIPEGSAGCTCGYPIQTSMAFAPVAAGQVVSGK